MGFGISGNSNAGLGNTVEMDVEVTGILPPENGGTGVANNAAATLTRSGDHAITVTTTDTTSVTLPTSGTLAGSNGSTTDNAITRFNGTTGQIQDSVVRIADTTGTMTWHGDFRTGNLGTDSTNGPYDIWLRTDAKFYLADQMWIQRSGTSNTMIVRVGDSTGGSAGHTIYFRVGDYAEEASFIIAQNYTVANNILHANAHFAIYPWETLTTLTADNQALVLDQYDTGSQSRYRITSSGAGCDTATNRTLVLGNGLYHGQILWLHNVGDPTTNAWELPNAANVVLTTSGAFTPVKKGDNISFSYDSADQIWYETSRAMMA